MFRVLKQLEVLELKKARALFLTRADMLEIFQNNFYDNFYAQLLANCNSLQFLGERYYTIRYYYYY